IFDKQLQINTDIYKYNHQLAKQAGDLITQMWNSSTLTTNDQFISTMNNIQLPSFIDRLDKMNIYIKN
ncbi:unnamed protein product, partial [Rotaria magnacalcarata]